VATGKARSPMAERRVLLTDWVQVRTL